MTTAISAICIVLGFLGAFATIALGVRGVRDNRAFICRAMWEDAVGFAIGLLWFADLLPRALSAPSDRVDRLCAVLVPLFIAMVVWRWTFGAYVVLGASDDALRNALHCALSGAKLPYEERTSGVYLPTVGVGFKLTSPKRGAPARLQARGAVARGQLRHVAGLMDQCFRERPTVPVSGVFATKALFGGLVFMTALLEAHSLLSHALSAHR